MLKKIDDALGGRWEMRQPRQAFGSMAVARSQRRESRCPDPSAGATEEVAARHQQLGLFDRVQNLFLCDRFVQIQQHAPHRCISGEFHRINRRIGR